MKQLKPRAVIEPEEAVRIARETAPHQPPALAPAPQVPTPINPTVAPKVASAMLAQRFTESTLDALARAAKAKGITQKVLIAQALAAAGVDVHPEDLRDRTPVRRRGN